MANKNFNIKLFGFKSESTQGSAASLSSTNYAYAEEVSPDQEVEKIEQNYTRTTLDPLPEITGKKSGKFSVTVPFRGSLVSNTANQVLLDLLKACGFGVSGGTGGTDWTIAPIDSTPSGMAGPATAGTGTIIMDGLVHSYPGSVGNAKMTFKAGERGLLACEMKGLDAAITDQSSWPSSPSASPISVDPPIFASGSVLIDNGSSHVVSEIEIDCGNELAMIEDGAATAGVKEFQITGKKPVITLTVLAKTVAAYDYWNKMRASTQINSSSIGLQFVLGTVAMNKFTFTVPTMQIKKIAPANLGGLLAFKLTCNPTFTSGADWMNIVADNA